LVHNLTAGNYRSAIDALFARTTSGTKFGLERTWELLRHLDDPHRRFRSIHVAGTNGKGSVVAMCDSILRANGLGVGRYTSPHLVDFRERILVDGVPISEAEVLKFLEEITPLSERIGATFFELTTVLAFQHFADRAVDVAVIETGLGGRLDSTNVLEPVAATVTSIGLDHTDLLGDTLEAIALEKAGIFKPDAPAIIGERDAGIAGLLENAARAAGARPVLSVDSAYRLSDVRVSAEGTSFVLETPSGSHRLRSRLVGAHQARNAAIAVATVFALDEQLAPNWDAIERGLARAHLPGRYQTVGKYIFDVAHNPDAARALAATLVAGNTPRPRTALLAVLSDKDWRGVIRELSPAVDRFIITSAPSAPVERLWDPAVATEYAESLGSSAELERDFDAALRKAGEAPGTVLITGSFHTVGAAMSRLQVSPFAA
jgi:dihydrofolate synthase/folylpolyglutamate synthase